MAVVDDEHDGLARPLQIASNAVPLLASAGKSAQRTPDKVPDEQ